ncbi:MAG: class II fructose-bisphosphate aldolase, partial [Anaerolineales bacterium]|nr:class II fructose-bisphosphate aldolase [Anaerolineales bacterium]
MADQLNDLLNLVENSVQVEKDRVKVTDAARLRETIHRWVEVSVLESGPRQGWARFLTRAAALDLGILPASIHELYMARGRGEVPFTFTVPAINLRVLSFDAARAVFRQAKRMDAAAFIFEIARSEIGYSSQRPPEYATNVLAAAIAEGYTDPVFIQGDHFQVSAKRYAAHAEAELGVLKDLTREAIAAGFFNIDVDTSTLVDISKPTVAEQQELNVELSVMFSVFIRALEPKGVTISIGGEIGEVGGRNSTADELRAYLDGYLAALASRAPGAPGLSKISIQTGTSHGGVVLPDGTIAKVSVDFDTLRDLSRVSRSAYGLAGTVQHGASTLPEDAFGKFLEYEATEVHLATNFMNMFYDRIPDSLRKEMYAWLDVNAASERKPDMTDEQFYYKTRKNALGAFKPQMYALPVSVKEE